MELGCKKKLFGFFLNEVCAAGAKFFWGFGAGGAGEFSRCGAGGAGAFLRSGAGGRRGPKSEVAPGAPGKKKHWESEHELDYKQYSTNT